MPRGRPRTPNKRRIAYQVLLNAEEDAAFGRLLATLNAELPEGAEKMTAPRYFRSVIARDVAARGLVEVSEPPTAPPPSRKA